MELARDAAAHERGLRLKLEELAIEQTTSLARAAEDVSVLQARQLACTCFLIMSTTVAVACLAPLCPPDR